MSQQNVVEAAVPLTAANVLDETKKLVADNPTADLTVESVLVGNLKRWNTMLSGVRINLAEFRVAGKATGQLLTKLKAQRLEADRNGGGARTSKLTKEINSGRSIINQTRDLVEQHRTTRGHYVQMRNAVLDALRLYYKEITQG